jgi:hypothetical protein
LSLFFFASAVMAQEAASPQTTRFPQFDNDKVKVWKSIVLPNQPLPLHRHDHPRIIIALQGGTMKLVEDDGVTETHQWQDNTAYWLPANRAGTLHTDENVGNKPIEVMVVELLKEH